MTQAHRDIRRKLAVLRHAEATGNVSDLPVLRHLSGDLLPVAARLSSQGRTGSDQPQTGCRPGTRPKKIFPPIEEKILRLRQRYHFGPERISWYLKRYHGFEITSQSVYRVLKRHGLNRLPHHQRRRSIPSFRRYEIRVPGHHVQVDVKFLSFVAADGRKVRRFQYTAIDDATRVRALKIFPATRNRPPSSS